MSRCTPRVYGSSPGAPRRSGRSAGRSASVYTGLTSMPESVKRRGSSGPTIGATVRRSSVAMGGRLRSEPMTLGVTGVSELVLEVADLERAERFYTEVLDL